VVDIPDGKDKWTKLDKDSELMEDVEEVDDVARKRRR
jgi:hypothetical protein